MNVAASLLLGSLGSVHAAWAWVVVVGNGAAGVWALGAHRWESLRVPGLWWFTAVVETAVVVQAALGVAVVAAQDGPGPRFHMFYGFLAVVSVGILYSYRQQLRRRVYLLYGFGGLFVMGLAIRAMVVHR